MLLPVSDPAMPMGKLDTRDTEEGCAVTLPSPPLEAGPAAAAAGEMAVSVRVGLYGGGVVAGRGSSSGTRRAPACIPIGPPPSRSSTTAPPPAPACRSALGAAADTANGLLLRLVSCCCCRRGSECCLSRSAVSADSIARAAAGVPGSDGSCMPSPPLLLLPPGEVIAVVGSEGVPPPAAPTLVGVRPCNRECCCGRRLLLWVWRTGGCVDAGIMVLLPLPARGGRVVAWPPSPHTAAAAGTSPCVVAPSAAFDVRAAAAAAVGVRVLLSRVLSPPPPLGGSCCWLASMDATAASRCASSAASSAARLRSLSMADSSRWNCSVTGAIIIATRGTKVVNVGATHTLGDTWPLQADRQTGRQAGRQK
jgi:hypothetical protein